MKDVDNKQGDRFGNYGNQKGEAMMTSPDSFLVPLPLRGTDPRPFRKRNALSTKPLAEIKRSILHIFGFGFCFN